MSITITLQDANNDGTGINFLSYLGNYDSTFAISGPGAFNNPAAGPFSGTEFAIKNADASTSVVTGAAAGNTLDYNFPTHTLEGSLDSVSFGSGVAYNGATDSFDQTNDIDITGLGLSGTGPANDVHNVVNGLMNADTSSLLSQFDNGVTYVSSTGNDVMTGFAGDDTFVFNSDSGFDVVDNFDTDGDLLDVSGWGVEDFCDLLVVSLFGNSYITDGAEGAIKVTGVTGLDADDFVFA